MTVRRAVAALAIALGIVGGSAMPAAAAAPPLGQDASATPVFGPQLDWTADTPQHYAQRLGGTPGVYGDTLGYPLRAADRSDLAGAARAAAAQGANLLVQLEPRAPLASLTSGAARALADAVQAVAAAGHIGVLVDFAPEMNGSWTTWGQQPLAYVAAYRTVAAAVHDSAPDAAMVWEPANGAGYPFGTARGVARPSGPRVVSQLDTDGNGRVDARDDPYGPYWPGRAAVDRVGLSVYWYGPTAALGANARPPANWFTGSLTGAVGYAAPGPGRDFVARFSVAQHAPMLVVTGALYAPSSATGPSEQAIEATWIQQVFATSARVRFPSIDTVVWLEQRRREAEARGALVDWRVTSDAGTAGVLHRALRAAGIALGPVPSAGGREQANAAVAQALEPATTGGQSGRVLGGIAVLLALLVIAGAAGRWRPAWRYPPAAAPSAGTNGAVTLTLGRPDHTEPTRGGRDRRIDWLRGFVAAAVVIVHIEVAGPWSWFVERAGALTGAEMFVLLSGIVLGSSYPVMAARHGNYAATSTMVRRAARLYLYSLAVILTVFFVSKIPGLDASSVTSFTDRGTGPAVRRPPGGSTTCTAPRSTCWTTRRRPTRSATCCCCATGRGR